MKGFAWLRNHPGTRFGELTLRLAMAATLSTMAMVGLQVLPASATVPNPYTSGTTGYDASYPQCPAVAISGSPSPTPGFAIIGLGDGRPFTTNPCISTLWGQAASLFSNNGADISGYFNSGYSGAYAKNIDSYCSAASSTISVGSGLSKRTTSQYQQAWAIGCSEADYQMAVNLTIGTNGVNPATWWVDVETGNSWSTNVMLNQWTINGITQELASPIDQKVTSEGGHPVGIYSYPAAWNSITGVSSYTPTSSDASWLAGVKGATCNSTSFDGNPLWFVQSGSFYTADADVSCG